MLVGDGDLAPTLTLGRRFETSQVECRALRAERAGHCHGLPVGPECTGARAGPADRAIGAGRAAACRDRRHQPDARGSRHADAARGVARCLSRCGRGLQPRAARHAGAVDEAPGRPLLPARHQRPCGGRALRRRDPGDELGQRPPGARIHAAARPAGHAAQHGRRPGAQRGAGHLGRPGAGRCNRRREWPRPHRHPAMPARAQSRAPRRAGAEPPAPAPRLRRRPHRPLPRRRPVPRAPGRLAQPHRQDRAAAERVAGPDAGGLVPRQSRRLRRQQHEPAEGRRGADRAVGRGRAAGRQPRGARGDPGAKRRLRRLPAATGIGCDHPEDRGARAPGQGQRAGLGAGQQAGRGTDAGQADAEPGRGQGLGAGSRRRPRTPRRRTAPRVWPSCRAMSRN